MGEQDRKNSMREMKIADVLAGVCCKSILALYPLRHDKIRVAWPNNCCKQLIVYDLFLTIKFLTPLQRRQAEIFSKR